MNIALRNDVPTDPEDADPRFCSGVPAEARARGLSFIEMSGIPRPAWLRGEGTLPSAAQPQTTIAPTLSTRVSSGGAAELLQGLIDEMSGAVPGHVTSAEVDEVNPQPLAEAPTPGEVVQESTATIMPLRPMRPSVALQALAEAEQLFQALDRGDGASSTGLPDETLSMLQQALAADLSVEPESQSEVPPAEADIGVAHLALEETLPPLEDFVDGPATPIAKPMPQPESPAQKVASGISPPGYTVLGDGPITWPGQPQPATQSRPGWALVLVLIVGALAAAAWWIHVHAPLSREAAMAETLGLWSPQPLWAVLSASKFGDTLAFDQSPTGDDARSLALAGLAALQEGRFGDARRQLSDALNATPGDPVLRLVVLRAQARACAKLGDGAAARGALRAAIQLPENLARDRDYRALAEIAREEAATAVEPEQRDALLREAMDALRSALVLPELRVEDRRELRNMIAWLDVGANPASATETTP